MRGKPTRVFKSATPNKSLGKKVSDYFNEHVNSSVGISNQLLNRLALGMCSRDYLGVFAADCIPPFLAGRPRFIVILNLARKKSGHQSVGHFVTVLANPNSVYYVDPYGMKCVQPDVERFLRECGRTVRQNKRQYQDMKSVYCGMYCLLFAAYADRRNSANPPKFKLRFFRQKKKLLANDTKCVQYVRRLINE